MPVRSTFSGRAVLAEISTSLSSIDTTAQAQDSKAEDVNHSLEEMSNELKKIRTGHELHNWSEEVNEPREEA